MYLRSEWIQRIEEAFDERSIVWLKGVRRVGKTVLCRSLPDAEYFDCELPRTRQLFEDPEGFLNDMRGKRIVLDEIHRLTNPSEVLKIAADHYPNIQIIATGSSTLGASEKFRDTLTGRKRTVWLTPMTLADSRAFQQDNLTHRLQRGGLPPFFLADSLPESDYQEWLDSYWAKDIQELFRLERRASFQRLVELMAAQSGGIFEATRFAGPCEINRQTVTNYLAVLEATLVAHVVRPFSTRRSTELVSAPKVYAFDTGFVCYARGWHDLRPDDLGLLWEHFVLNEMQASLQTQQIHYWRDKNKHEIDFVIRKRGGAPDAIECKWSAGEFDPKNLLAFRRQYSHGKNWVVSADVDQSYTRQVKGVEVRYVGLRGLVNELAAAERIEGHL
jgi:predicted AAA+ superfamily ATPase